MATNGVDGKNAAPPVSTAAVLKQSITMPDGAQKVDDLNFDDFAGRSMTVEDLINSTSNMGFQASSIGEAVRIINEMARNSSHLLSYFFNLVHNNCKGANKYHCREPGDAPRLAIEPPYFSATLRI